MKTIEDFQPEVPTWLVDDWFPLGHRGMDTAPEGSFKTMLGCWMAVCIASGTKLFGHPVLQGPVLIVDEETPQTSLDNHLVRFANGLGYKLTDLPIHRLVMTGFRFGKKSELWKLLKIIEKIKPVFIRMDSMIAMLPAGSGGLQENDSHLGEIIRDDLTAILNKCSAQCSILLSAHAKKMIGGLTIEELKEYDMPRIVRGHGSIVGEGCDTGYVIKKISERTPTRFVVQVRSRRAAIPAGEPLLVELEEQKYGSGWARLKLVDINKLPPSEAAQSLYPIFLERNKDGDPVTYKERDLISLCALKVKKDIKDGVYELWVHKVVERGDYPRSYIMNIHYKVDVDPEYLQQLKVGNNVLHI